MNTKLLIRLLPVIPIVLPVLICLFFVFSINQGSLEKGGKCPPLKMNVEVWLDQNGDGVRQSNEPPIPNIQPIFMDAESALGVKVVRTEWDGIGRIEALYAPKRVLSVLHCQFLGRKVTIDVPDGYELTTPDQRRVNSSSSLSFGLKSVNSAVPPLTQHFAKTDCQSFDKPNQRSMSANMRGVVDSDEQLWIVTSHHGGPKTVARYDKATEKMTWADLNFYFRGYDSTRAVDSDGVHWAIVSDYSSDDKSPYSLHRYGDSEQPVVNVIDGFELGEVYSVSNTASGNLWLETDSGLVFYNINAKTHTHYPQFTASYYGEKHVFVAGDEIVYFVGNRWFAIGRGNPAEQVVEWEIYDEQNGVIPLVSTSDEYVSFKNPKTDFDGNIWFNGGDLYYNPHENQWHYPAVQQSYSAHATQSSSYAYSDRVSDNYFPTHDGNLWVYHPLRHDVYYVHNTRYTDKGQWPVLRLAPRQQLLYVESDNIIWLNSYKAILRCQVTFVEE